MFQKLFIAAFVIAGLLLIGQGLIDWDRQSEVRVTLDQFAESLIKGDRALFLSSLHEDLREHYLANEDKSDFVPLPDAIYHIKFIDIEDEYATSELKINGDGFLIRPSVTLKRDQNSAWKIIELDRDKKDPLYSSYEKEIDNLSDQERKSLRAQLEEKIKNQKLKEEEEKEKAKLEEKSATL